MKEYNLSIKDWALVIIISTLMMSVFFSLGLFALQNQFRKELDQQVDQALTKIQDVVKEAQVTLLYLNSLNVVGCGPITLKEMQKTLFDSQYIKGISFKESANSICNAGIQNTRTTKKTSPDFIGPKKISVWLNTPLSIFDFEKNAITIEQDKFTAVISEVFLKHLTAIDASWELIFLEKDTKRHIEGTPNLFKEVELGRHANDINALKCSDSISYCFAISSTKKLFYKTSSTMIFIWFICSFLIFIISFILLLVFFERYRSIESRVIRGIRKNCFYCLYQPIVALESRKVVGCEVLARFRDDKGELSPADFIPIIIKRGRTWNFTKKIINQFSLDAPHLKRSGDNLKVSFNFFAQDIDSGIILEILEKNWLKNEHFTFVIEVTEDEKLSNLSSVEVLNKLRSNGYLIAIDDFGTGYSNLRELKEFPCHILKIDKTFVSEMEDGAIRSSLIPHIVGISKMIDVAIVAEGIEYGEQQAALIKLGIDYGQGYLFGKPMKPEYFRKIFL